MTTARWEIPRSAVSILEVSVAVAMMAVLLATSMKMIHLMSNQQRASERWQVALQAAQAISEQIGNIRWEQLTAESANQIQIPAAIAPHLPGAELEITVSDESDPAAKRVLVEITWNGPGKRPARPVRLTSWVFPEVGQQ